MKYVKGIFLKLQKNVSLEIIHDFFKNSFMNKGLSKYLDPDNA